MTDKEKLDILGKIAKAWLGKDTHPYVVKYLDTVMPSAIDIMEYGDKMDPNNWKLEVYIDTPQGNT